MTKGDQQWIGKTVFSVRHQISDTAALTLWWYPPVTEASIEPQPDSYVLQSFFVDATEGMGSGF